LKHKHNGLHNFKADFLLQILSQLHPCGQELYMAIGAAVVVLTLIAVYCFVGFGFWGGEWIHRGKYFTFLTALGKVFTMWGCQMMARETSCMERAKLLLG
jgi:hypothetical protein